MRERNVPLVEEMMRARTLDRSLFDDLADKGGRDLISVYIPTYRRGRDVDQGRIRLRNQLAAIDDELARRGWKPRERSERLRHAHALLDDREFWEHQDAALGVFIDDRGGIIPIAMSRDVFPKSIVMPVYLLRPLLGDLNALDLQVLALTKAKVVLYQVRHDQIDEIECDLPKSFDDVNWFVDREKQRQQHPDRVGTRNGRHGHDTSGGGEDRARFLREVARALPTRDSELPLVVLGDDDLVVRFATEVERDVLSPPNSGLAAPWSEVDVLETVQPLLADLESARESRTAAMAAEQLGTGNATTDIAAALGDAVSGRLAAVVVDRTAAPVWGRIDEENLEVTIHGERAPADVDLVDRLITLSMGTGADVESLETAADGHPFVAVRRF